MTLIELLRWIVETWPEVDAAEWQAVILRAARRGIIIESWPGVAGAAEWQAVILRAARFGIAAGRERAPYDYQSEEMLTWWLTLLSTDPAEYNARWHRARHADPPDITFELDGPAGWGIGRLDGKPEPQYAAELIELDRQCHRCLDLLADFGRAGAYTVVGLVGTTEITYGREIWGAGGARPDFLRNALVLPDGAVIARTYASLVPPPPAIVIPNTPGSTADIAPPGPGRPAVARGVVERAIEDDLTAGKVTEAELDGQDDGMARRYTRTGRPIAGLAMWFSPDDASAAKTAKSIRIDHN